jgi:hypothetical protein
VNTLFCSEINIYLDNKKFHRIAFKNAPDSQFQPMQNINLLDYQLKNFNWRYAERPASLDDLLEE